MGLASVERIQELLPHLHGHAMQRRCELLRDAQPPAMMIAVDDASGIAIALSRGWQHHKRCVKSEGLRRAGVLAGLLAGPIFLVSVGLNTWASLGYLHQLAWEFVGGESRFRGLARWHAGRTVGRKLPPFLLRAC